MISYPRIHNRLDLFSLTRESSAEPTRKTALSKARELLHHQVLLGVFLSPRRAQHQHLSCGLEAGLVVCSCLTNASAMEGPQNLARLNGRWVPDHTYVTCSEPLHQMGSRTTTTGTQAVGYVGRAG